MEMHDWEKTDQEIPQTWGGGGREDNDIWLPHWTTLNDASKACSLLLHCGCARSCTGNCKCSRAGVHSRHWIGLNLTILMLNMEYQFLKLYLLLYDLMHGSELFNDVN